MKQQVFNPYLPSYEYVPDGEPHAFGDRVYLYGSHDHFDGGNFCVGDYVCWSAPLSDLSDWRYEGVIYGKTEDPDNKSGRRNMYAPDVCQGPDGRYYLYYFYDYLNKIAVAVSDTPAGKYSFYGYVHDKNGEILGRRKGDIFQFDPGVYHENGKTYLYTGFCPVSYPFFLTGGKPISKQGPVVTVLGSDMLTIAEEPKYLGIPCKVNGVGTPYEGHEFFEASSMRKIDGKYYFIWSTFAGHELAYAVSDRPDGGFSYGGVLVSIGDVGLRGIQGVKDAANFTGNTHGSILEDDGKFYIFYHRQTNRNCFSRQACAELLKRTPDGKFLQSELTSCGLNGGPLAGSGRYEARIACHLTTPKGGVFYSVMKGFGRPYFTQSGKDREENGDQYIANLTDGCCAGFKYFDFGDKETVSRLTLHVRGTLNGSMTVSDGKTELCRVAIQPAQEWTAVSALAKFGTGEKPLFFTCHGSGHCDFLDFEMK